MTKRLQEAIARFPGHCAECQASIVRNAPIVHDQADALDVLTTLKESAVPVALVHDEYGHFEGIVTPADILEAITGVFRADADADEPALVHREDGSMLARYPIPTSAGRNSF